MKSRVLSFFRSLALAAFGIALMVGGAASAQTATQVFDFSVFSSTSGWSSTGSSLSNTISPAGGGSTFVGTAPVSVSGYTLDPSVQGTNIAVFSYTDSSSIYRDYAIASGATSYTFSTTVLPAGGVWARTDDTFPNQGYISLQYLNSSGQVIGTTSSATITQNGSTQDVSVTGAVAAGATTVRVVFAQTVEYRFWAGNYGMAYTDPSLTFLSAAAAVPEIDGSKLPLGLFVMMTGLIGLGWHRQRRAAA